MISCIKAAITFQASLAPLELVSRFANMTCDREMCYVPTVGFQWIGFPSLPIWNLA